jgi:hypothetical protein
MILGNIHTLRPIFVNHKRGTLKAGTIVQVTDAKLSDTSLSGVTLSVLVHLSNDDYYHLPVDFFHVMQDRASLNMLKRAINRGEVVRFLKNLLVTKKYGL